MARFRADQGVNPWSASVQIDNKVYWIGSYPSKYLAQKAERIFRIELRVIRAQADHLWMEQFATTPDIPST